MADGMHGRAEWDHPSHAATLDAARRLAARRRRGWPRRHLSGPVSALIWLLRIYAVGMLAVVAVQLVRLV